MHHGKHFCWQGWGRHNKHLEKPNSFWKIFFGQTKWNLNSLASTLVVYIENMDTLMVLIKRKKKHLCHNKAWRWKYEGFSIILFLMLWLKEKWMQQSIWINLEVNLLSFTTTIEAWKEMDISTKSNQWLSQSPV